MNISVLMSVYHREKAEYLDQALESLRWQTHSPAEVVLVEDGPIGSELSKVISRYESSLPIKRIPLSENIGLGAALRVGTEYCTCDWIARFDTDDICLPHRLQRQVEYLSQHPNVDLLGASILEFEHSPEQPQYRREVPERSPFWMSAAIISALILKTTTCGRGCWPLGSGCPIWLSRYCLCGLMRR